MSIAHMPKRSRTPGSLLGLNLQAGRLEGVALRRSNGSVHVQQILSAALALNPLNGDPELAGREIRNHLEQAGIRQRKCAVCVPLAWALTLPVKVPAMPAEDLPSFLELEAERGFPYSPEALSVASSVHRLPGGETHAFLVAIQRQPLEQLDKVLRAAQLRPVSFTLALPALQPAHLEPERGILALLPGENAVDLQITALGGWIALRTIEGAVETEAGQRRLQPDVLHREIRVTLGQLPAELRQRVRTVRLFGSGDFAQRAETELRPRIEAMGLQFERVAEYSPGPRILQSPRPSAPPPRAWPESRLRWNSSRRASARSASSPRGSHPGAWDGSEPRPPPPPSSWRAPSSSSNGSSPVCGPTGPQSSPASASWTICRTRSAGSAPGLMNRSNTSASCGA